MRWLLIDVSKCDKWLQAGRASSKREWTLKVHNSRTSGLYYKHVTIVNYASRGVNKLKASLNDNARVVIYDHRMFIVQATAEPEQIWDQIWKAHSKPKRIITLSINVVSVGQSTSLVSANVLLVDQLVCRPKMAVALIDIDQQPQHRWSPTHNFKIKGSNPATGFLTEKMAKKKRFIVHYWAPIAYW